MLETFKKIDAFPKAFDDFKVKTTSGAVVSIISVLIMTLLFIAEMQYYLKTEVVDHLYVNTTRTDKLKVDFDISFPEVPCNLLSLDAADDTGMPQKDAVHEIYKHKITSGKRVGVAERAELGDTLQTEKQLEDMTAEDSEKLRIIKEQIGSCGNCYGAAAAGLCCNTCDDVKAAYARMGWRFKPQGIIQCTSEAFLANMKEQFAEDGGCQIFGELELSKGSGQFHIAPHKKIHQGGKDNQQQGLFNLMDLISFTFDQFNVSHTINTLSFGDNFPGINSPLDGQTRKVQDTHGMYQYYVKVVPTKYKALGSNNEIQSNQYSATEHISHLAPGSGRGLPGVYFYYEVSPIQARFEEKRRTGGLLGLITSLCAIIGGAFSLMGLVDLLFGAIAQRCFGRSVLD